MEDNLLGELQNCVRNWIQNEQILKVKRNEIKELNLKKKDLEELILSKMNMLKINIVNLSSGGKLQKSIKKSKKNLKKDDFIEHIYSIIDNNELSEKLIKTLEDAKPCVEKEKISFKK